MFQRSSVLYLPLKTFRILRGPARPQPAPISRITCATKHVADILAPGPLSADRFFRQGALPRPGPGRLQGSCKAPSMKRRNTQALPHATQVHLRCLLICLDPCEKGFFQCPTTLSQEPERTKPAKRYTKLVAPKPCLYRRHRSMDEPSREAPVQTPRS